MLSSPGAENKGRKTKRRKKEHNATLAFNVIGNSLKKSGPEEKVMHSSSPRVSQNELFSLQN